MNIQKFTQKSIEAINGCEKLAYEYGNQEIEQEHLLVSLLLQEDGLIPKLIEKMEINKEHFTQNAQDHLAKRVKVSGGQIYMGQNLNKVLVGAEDMLMPGLAIIVVALALLRPRLDEKHDGKEEAPCP